jgi:hypothetical protein
VLRRGWCVETRLWHCRKKVCRLSQRGQGGYINWTYRAHSQ